MASANSLLVLREEPRDDTGEPAANAPTTACFCERLRRSCAISRRETVSGACAHASGSSSSTSEPATMRADGLLSSGEEEASPSLSSSSASPTPGSRADTLRACTLFLRRLAAAVFSPVASTAAASASVLGVLTETCATCQRYMSTSALYMLSNSQ
eukprot:1585090-Prymnesium_polylepis.1